MKLRPIYWGAAVLLIAILNIVEVLPDWATIAAVLTAPFFFSVSGARCAVSKSAR